MAHWVKNPPAVQETQVQSLVQKDPLEEEMAFSLEEKYISLDSILKSRDITLLTKVRLVKAMVFPVVMYGFETCTVKKAEELMLLNCGVGEDA